MSLGNTNIHQKGQIPEIVKLPNDRIRVIRRFHKFTREDVDNSNLGSLMGDFGALDATGEEIVGQGYTNCRLISVEVENFSDQANSDSPVLVKTYETLTDSFVETTDPTVEVLENGLKRITKVFRAKSGTTNTDTVGSSSLSSGEILSSSTIEDNTAFAELTQVYVEEGTLFESIEEVGSQKAKVIETIGTAPDAPTDYVLARKEESNFEGIKTNRYTFLQKNVVLSVSEDKVGSQLAVTNEIFKPDSESTYVGVNVSGVALSGYVQANREKSDFVGIPTERFTFLKNNVILSESTDSVGSQKAIIREIFGNDISDPSESGYEIAKTEESEVSGIPTKRFTLLKTDIELSRSLDKVGSQEALVVEFFKRTSTADPTETDYVLAKSEKSDIGGFPTERFTFLKPDVVLSTSDDKLGSLEIFIEEIFEPASAPSKSGFTEVKREESEVDGIKTQRVTFYKDNAIISKSMDKVGSQKSVVIEKFKEKPDASDANSFGDGTDYAIAREEVEGKAGAEIYRYTFLQKNTELSRQTDKLGALEIIITEVFNPTSDATEASYTEVNREVSDFEGIKTERYTFYKDDAIISNSFDVIGSQQSVVIRKFKTEPTVGEAQGFGDNAGTYSIAKKEVEGKASAEIYNYTFLKNDTQLSETEDLESTLKTISKEFFKPADSRDTLTDFALIRKESSNVDGVPTTRFTFAKKKAIISQSLDTVGSQQAVVITKFQEEPSVADAKSFAGTDADYVIARKEESGEELLQTFKYTFLVENSILFKSEDKDSALGTIVEEIFKPDNDADEKSNYKLIDQQESNVEGIPTTRFTFVKEKAIVSQSVELVGSQKAVVIRKFQEAPTETEAEDVVGGTITDGYAIAKKEEEGEEDLKTFVYTFLQKNSVLSVSSDKVGSQLSVINEVFAPRVGFKGFDVDGNELEVSANGGYIEARREESNFDGISTSRITFLKQNTTLLVSEDKLGSQKAVINEVFSPAPSDAITGKDVSGTDLEDGEDGYIEARREKSDFEGIPTIKYTFLKRGAVLSKTEDKESTLGTIVEEIFKPKDDASEKNEYLLLREEESDVDGIPTKRFTFAKENVIVSSRVDSVGAQEAVVITKFGNEEPDAQDAEEFADAKGETQGDFQIARKEKSGVPESETYVYTFLRPSILNVRQEFVEGGDIVDVQAFKLSDSEVESKLESVTAEHQLIDQFESDIDGIETRTFRFKLKTYTTKETLENGLESTTTYEIATEEPTSLQVGAEASEKVLTSFNVVQGKGLFSIEKTETETGILSKERISAGDGLVRVTTVFFGQKAREDDTTIVGPVISETLEDHDGFQTVTVVSLENTSGATILGKDNSTDKETLVSFTYPGVVFINTVELPSGTNATNSFTAKDFVLEPPVEKLIKATEKVFYTESPEMEEYTGQEGLWCPERWAMGITSGIGWYYTPFSEAQGFRGYRIDPDKTNAYYETAEGSEDEGNNWDMIAGRRIWGGTRYLIQVKDGPEDPEGKEYTLDYKVEVEAEFLSEATSSSSSSSSSSESSSGEVIGGGSTGGSTGGGTSSTSPSSSGKIIYKHTEIVATIPARDPATAILSSGGSLTDGSGDSSSSGGDGGYGTIGGD